MLGSGRTKALLAGLVAFAALAGAAPAGAATTIGQTGNADFSCGDGGDVIVQATTATSPRYSVPAGGGVITSWRSQNSGGTGKLIVVHPTSNPADFVVVGKSGLEGFASGVATSFATRIAVREGDLLGIRVMSDGNFCLLEGSGDGDTIRYNFYEPQEPDPANGSTTSLPNLFANRRISISAVVEPDADGDGFGDESQDGCPTDASTQEPCPPGSDFSFGKVKKNKRKGTAKLTVNVPGPGELELAKTKKVKADEEPAEDAGKEKLSIKGKGKARKKLNKKGKAKVKAEVTYTPDGGSPNTESKKIKLVKR